MELCVAKDIGILVLHLPSRRHRTEIFSPTTGRGPTDREGRSTAIRWDRLELGGW